MPGARRHGQAVSGYTLLQTIDNFVLGITEPTWENSGCRIPQGSLTTDTTTNLITTADNQVISGLYLPYGRIEVRHKNVTIRDCVIRIGYSSSRLYVQNNCAVVTNPSYDTRGLNMEYVTCDPLNAGAGGIADDAQVSGFYFINGRAYRCAARYVTDGFMPDINGASGSGPSQILDCYVQTRWLSYDKEQSDGTHNDCVQLAGAAGNVIRGNTFHNPTGGVTDPGSGHQVKGQNVVFTPYHGAIDSAVVDQNWFYGSYTQVAIWIPYSYGPQPQSVTVTNNRHAGQCVWPILITPEVNSAKISISGNVAGVGGVKWNNGTIAQGNPVNPYIVSAPA